MNDEELRTAAQALETYNAQLENLSRQVSVLRATREETLRASRALTALAAAKEGEEVLIPVGASAMVRVKVTGKDVVTGIGRGVSIERPASEAAEKMEQDRAEVETALQEAVATMQEIQGYVRELTTAVQQEYQQRRAAAGTR